MFLQNPTLKDVTEKLQPELLNVLLIGESCQVQINALVDHCNQNDLQVAGGIFPGVIYGKQHADDGIILKAFTKDTQVSVLQDISRISVEDLPEIHPRQKSALLLADGLSSGISHLLETIYGKYWNDIKFIGGGCGSLSLAQQPCVFSNQGFFENAALLIPLGTELSLGVSHGWKKIAGPYLVSASEGNRISELDWQAAFQVYREVVNRHSGLDLTVENFFEIAKAFPFGIVRESMEDVVRDPIITDGKTLTCVGEVSPNTTVSILNGNMEDLLSGAKKAATEALSGFNGDNLLVVDCISRALFMEENFEKELKEVNRVAAASRMTEMEGVLSLGEISSYGKGYLEFFNKTIVVGVY